MPFKRWTPQREAIESLFRREKRPLSADEVHRLSPPTGPRRLGIATVYRTLRSLQTSGILRTVELPGIVTHYELADLGHHHHLQCQGCEKVFDIQGCPGDFGDMVPPGFVVTGHEVVLYGLCPLCV